MTRIPRLTDSKTGLVFHYTSAEIALGKILESGRIRFGELHKKDEHKANDPYEFNWWNISSHYRGDSDQSRAAALSVWSVAERIKRCARRFCTCVDGRSKWIGGQESAVGRGFAIPPMWAHYGDGHRGVCLASDRKRLCVAARAAAKTEGWLVRGRLVQYRVPPALAAMAGNLDVTGWAANGAGLRVKKHIRSHLNRFLFTKDSAWRYEREFRIVTLLNDESADSEVPIETSLVGLITGLEFPECFGCAVKEARKRYHQLEIGMLNWDQGFPELYPR